ncbi:hypothetical protein MYCTH_69995 [Thermothelomyces thermophilus ATCC 42464]|uniref:Uncharacterized protein n=1 Tax=Thermothelomyces thermophilus (strain ATCC 42464 / BCRC 31852 / DSM 1799) TaxID=573729 RepID=G2QG24_THET4|nr:uncharacterized protein MYCTH_69995 [Thermothelomyces thermophilus ATCC 42464]AEO58489.1 hypothetical protein MYCTH_69995 [Thermothelomyces thermophilus ATCC 42464]
MPCSWYMSQGLVCKMIVYTKRYKAYVRRDRSYDSSSILLSSYKLLWRLRQQKEFLIEKGTNMVAYSLSTLDELEEVERQETPAMPSLQINDAVDAID